MFAPTDVCGVIKGCEINNNAKCQGGVGCRGRQPLHIVRGSLLCRKIATLFAGFTLFIWIEKAVQRFFLRHRFIVSFTFVCFFTFLHRLVGLRLLRLCLKLRQGFALYPQGTLSLDPASPLTPGLSLRFISRYARYWGAQLWSAMPIPHS